MNQRRANGEIRAQVLAVLQREADLDGLVTISQGEIADELGVHRTTVCAHCLTLIADGLISDTGRTQGISGHSVIAYQLAESVMA